MKCRAVFLDRDGVLNKAYPDGDTTRPPRSLDELELLPGVAEALGRLHWAGYALVVVTNQPDVARGKLTCESVESINAALCARLPLRDVFTCFHDTADQCVCRKPRPGLILAAASRWNIDLPGSFLIGDRWSDIAAAHVAGCRGVLIDTPFSLPERCRPDQRVSDITEAVNWILGITHAERSIKREAS